MSASDRVPPRSDAMPTTRGTNFYLADPNLELVCATVMRAEDFARARPHLISMGEVAGGELDALVGALYVKKWLRPPTPPASVFTARECEWLDAIADWTPIPAEALSAVAGRP